VAFIVTVFHTHSGIEISEMMTETEQEEKKGSKAEVSIDELFEKAILPAEEFLPDSKSPLPQPVDTGSLPEVHLDRPTPPPNA
jgi:hypothetical protein